MAFTSALVLATTLSNSFVVISALAFMGLMFVSLVSSVGLVKGRGAALLMVLVAAAGYFMYSIMVTTVPELFASLPTLTSLS
jgi:hypothetical protein